MTNANERADEHKIPTLEEAISILKIRYQDDERKLSGISATVARFPNSVIAQADSDHIVFLFEECNLEIPEMATLYEVGYQTITNILIRDGAFLRKKNKEEAAARAAILKREGKKSSEEDVQVPREDFHTFSHDHAVEVMRGRSS